MVTHTAVFQIKEGVTEEQIDALFAELRSLVGIIPGLISVTAGRQVRERSSEYPWGFTMYLNDKESLENYYPHPSHRAFAEKFKAIAQKIIDFDIVE
jgi:hypothetical protein